MSRVLYVEYSDVISCAHNGSVVRVRHKLDREDVAPMTRQYGRREAELRCGRFGMVRVDIDAVVVRAGSKQTTRRRPAVTVSYYS